MEDSVISLANLSAVQTPEAKTLLTSAQSCSIETTFEQKILREFEEAKALQ